MGVFDAFTPDERVSLKVNELIGYFRNEARVNAQNEVLKNGIRARLPYSHILVMIGETDPIAKNSHDENLKMEV